MARFAASDTLPIRAWYNLQGPEPVPIGTMAQLHPIMAQSFDQLSLAGGRAQAAHQQFTQQVQTITERYQERVRYHTDQYQDTLKAKARRLLEKAALVEIALGQQQPLFSGAGYPTGFSETAVAGLSRHKSPWTWMLFIGGKPLPRPQDTDPFYDQVRNEGHEKLQEVFRELTGEARDILQAWRAVQL
jgi:hypothetical protein